EGVTNERLDQSPIRRRVAQGIAQVTNDAGGERRRAAACDVRRLSDDDVTARASAALQVVEQLKAALGVRHDHVLKSLAKQGSEGFRQLGRSLDAVRHQAEDRRVALGE